MAVDTIIRPAPTLPAPVAPTVRARAVPGTQEFVSGGPRPNGLTNQTRALPTAIDDITADFGDDLYERMLVDPQIAAAVNLLKLAVISQGVSLTNPMPREHSRHARAQEILEFCERNLRRLATPLEQTLYELLDGMAFGYKMAEKIYEIPTDGPDKGKLCLRALKVKSRRSVAFVVDSYLNIVAILAVDPRRPSSSLRSGVLVSGQDVLLPREKFVIFNYRTKDSDPRGASILRPAYAPWWYKKQIEQEYLRYLSQFAGPSLDGVLPEGAEPVPYQNSAGQYTDALGNVLADQSAPIFTDPATDFLLQLLEFRNGTALVRPFGSDLKTIDMQGDGQPFRFALEYCNDEIVQPTLGQKLATGESKNMARAAAQTHQDVLDMFVGEGKRTLSYTIHADICRQLVELNYGPADLDCTPNVSLPSTEHQDFPAYAGAVASLHRYGWFTPSQIPPVNAMLGLPLPEEGEQPIVQPSAQPPAPEGDQEDAPEKESAQEAD